MSLALKPEWLVPVAFVDENALLEAPAARTGAEDLELDEGLLGRAWRKLDHPRWPKGAPNGRGGEFVRVGERFAQGGHVYEVANILNGKVYAHEASGDYDQVEEITVKPKKASGGLELDREPVAPKVTSGGKNQKGDSQIISPYVDFESHDPTLKLPDNSTFTAEDWECFGQEDQENYIELMDRFGVFDPEKASGLTQEIYAAYDDDVRLAVEQAYSMQYASSSGQLFSLASLNTTGDFDAAAEKYAEGKMLLHDLSAVIQWDLYNRTHAADIAVFHKGDTSPQSYNDQYIEGNEAIYSGYSQSFKFSANDSGPGGPNTLATPTAIRHIVMSSYSVQSDQYVEEYEVAVADRQKLDNRSVAFTTSTMGFTGDYQTGNQVRSWLIGKTNEPGPGRLIRDLQATWDGKGVIPIPPPKPDIQYKPEPGAHMLELDAAEAAKAAKQVMAASHAKADTEILNQMGLQPGDMIEGLKGARYVILADPSVPQGMRYVKIEGDGLNYQKAWPLSGEPFWRLDGHYDVPKPKLADEFVPFGPTQYKELVNGEPVKLNQMDPGTMFKVESNGWKVIGPDSYGKVHIESLDTGKKATANGAYKAAPLLPSPKFKEPTAGPQFEQGDITVVLDKDKGGYVIGTVLGPGAEEDSLKVKHPDGTVIEIGVDDNERWEFSSAAPSHSPDSIEQGDIFPMANTRYTVTSIMKDGTVRARAQGAKKVEKISPATMKAITDADMLFRPSDWALDDKVKLKALSVGDLFSGSDKKVRPYEVIDTTVGGGQVRVQNVETGEMSTVSANKSWAKLRPADLEVHDEYPQVPPNPSIEYDATTVMFPKVADGELFAAHNYAGKPIVWQKLPTQGSTMKAKPVGLLENSKITDPPEGIPDHQVFGYVELLTPKTGVNFDILKYQYGLDTGSLSSLANGTIFGNPVGKWAFIKLGDLPDGGISALNLVLNEKTTFEADFDGGAKIMTPKPTGLDLSYEDATPGDLIAIAHLPQGALYKSDPASPTWEIVTPFSDTAGTVKLAGDYDASAKPSLNGPGKLVTLISKPSSTDATLSSIEVGASAKIKINGVIRDVTVVTATKDDKTVMVEWTAWNGAHTKQYKESTLVSLSTPVLDLEWPPPQKPTTDLVALDKIPVGSQFVAASGQTVTLLSAPTYGFEGATAAYVDDPDHVFTLATPGPNAKFKVVSSPPPTPEPQATLNDVLALPYFDGYDTYLHPKGGSHYYPKVGGMDVGTFFQDKAGHKFMVKGDIDQGFITVTDGHELFKLGVHNRGKVSDQPLFEDQSPPLISDLVSQVKTFYPTGAQDEQGNEVYSDTVTDVSNEPQITWNSTSFPVSEWIAKVEKLPSAHMQQKRFDVLNHDELTAVEDYAIAHGYTKFQSLALAADEANDGHTVALSDLKPGDRAMAPSGVVWEITGGGEGKAIFLPPWSKHIELGEEGALVDAGWTKLAANWTPTGNLVQGPKLHEGQKVYWIDSTGSNHYVFEIKSASEKNVVGVKLWASPGNGPVGGSPQQMGTSNFFMPLPDDWSPPSGWDEQPEVGDSVPVSALQPGMFVKVGGDANSVTWQVMQGGDAPFGKVVSTDQFGDKLMPMGDWPWLIVDGPGQAPSETVGFDDLGGLSYFESVGGVWRKSSVKNATLVMRLDQNQLASIGEALPFAAAPGDDQEQVTPIPASDLATYWAKAISQTTEPQALFDMLAPLPLEEATEMVKSLSDADLKALLAHINANGQWPFFKVVLQDELAVRGLAEPEAPSAPKADVLKGYLHPKGGKFHYPKISALANGSTFTDKTKTVYTVVAAPKDGSKVSYKDADGNVYFTSGDTRVKIDGVAGASLAEGRLVFSTNGSVSLAA